MKFFVSLLLAGSIAAVASPTARFYDQLSPEAKRAAGIEELSPQQQAALSLLADEWVTTKAQSAINAARDRAVAEVRAEKKSRVGFPDQPTAADAIRSRLQGTFRGWSRGTVFRLENGQVWVVDGPDSRHFSARENVEVEIQPAAFGTWKLHVMPEGLWVRVKRMQ